MEPTPMEYVIANWFLLFCFIVGTVLIGLVIRAAIEEVLFRIERYRYNRTRMRN